MELHRGSRSGSVPWDPSIPYLHKQTQVSAEKREFPDEIWLVEKSKRDGNVNTSARRWRCWHPQQKQNQIFSLAVQRVLLGGLQDVIRRSSALKHQPQTQRMKAGLLVSPRWCLQHRPFLFRLAPASFFAIFTQLHHSSLLFNSNLSSPNLLPLALKISVYESLPRLTGFWREQENLPSPVDVNTHSRLGILQLQEQTQQGFSYHKGLIWGIHIVPGEIPGTYWILWSAIEREISVLTAPTMQNNYPLISYLAAFGMRLNKCLNPRKGGGQQCSHFVREAFVIFPFLGPNGPTALQNYT